MKLVGNVIDARYEVGLLQRLTAALAPPTNPNNFRRPVCEAAIRLGTAQMLAQLRKKNPREAAHVRAEMRAIRRTSGIFIRE